MLGITGTGGSGKSSLTDELVRRLRMDQHDHVRVAVLAVDPTRRRGGGALLGDRIRMNSLDLDGPGLDRDRVYFRSLATRGAHELPEHLTDVIAAVKAAGFDLVVVETPGIGQGDAAVVPFVDTSLYVMTPEYGAASQLEKIDMLDFADAVAINKFERRGAADALREVARQLVRNREAFGQRPEDMPVFGTSAATFDDDGVTALYQFLRGQLTEHGLDVGEGALAPVEGKTSTRIQEVLPPDRVRYLVRDLRHRARLPRADRGAGRRRAPGAAVRRRRGRGRGRASVEELAQQSVPTTCRDDVRDAARASGPPVVERVRRRPRPRVPVGHPDPPRRRTPDRGPRRAGALLAPREPARAASPSPPASSRSSATTRTRPGCSPARATRSAPTAASSCSPRASRRPGCRRRSTR